MSLVLLKLWFSGSGEPVVCMLFVQVRGDCVDSGFVSGHSRLNDECDFQQYLSL